MRRWRIHALCLILCAVPIGAGAEEGPSSAVMVELEPQEVKLGEPLQVTIRVRGQPGVSYDLPEVIDLGPFVELGRSRQRKGRQDVLGLKVAVYDQVGEVTLPAFQLKVEAPDGGEPPELSAPEVKVKISSVLEGLEQPQPRDIAGPMPVWVHDYRPMVYLGLVLLWILGALVVGRGRAAGRVSRRLVDLPPPPLAHQIAYEKLHRIVEDDLLRKGEFREYFIRVSETIREYLGNRYGFFALDLTSRELLEELRDRPTPGLEHGRLKQLLESADLVKFARLQPTDEMSSGAIDSAYTLVNATRRVPEQEQPAEREVG